MTVPKKKKDQFVIAYLADLDCTTGTQAAQPRDTTQTVVDYARAVAKFLHKGLILLYICDKKYTKVTTDEAQKRLTAIKEQYNGEDISFCALKGKTRDVISLLPTALNAVIVVAGVDRRASLLKPTNPRRVIWDFGQCRTAYLTVQPHASSNQYNGQSGVDPTFSFKHVALRIDYQRESKEKLIWASYFARFNDSKLHVMHEVYKDSGLRTKFDNNMLFLDKFFGGLGVGYETETLPTVANFPDKCAVKQASEKGYSLMICITTDTREMDFLDWFISPQETRVIKNKQNLPVLFINPRDDIYVLCD